MKNKPEKMASLKDLGKLKKDGMKDDVKKDKKGMKNGKSKKSGK